MGVCFRCEHKIYFFCGFPYENTETKFLEETLLYKNKYIHPCPDVRHQRPGGQQREGTSVLPTYISLTSTRTQILSWYRVMPSPWKSKDKDHIVYQIYVKQICPYF